MCDNSVLPPGSTTTRKASWCFATLTSAILLALGSGATSFAAQWVGTNTTYFPGASQEWQVGTNWQAGSPPPAGEFVLIGQDTNPNQPVVAYLNTTTNAVQSVANMYGSHFVMGSSGILNLSETEGRLEVGKFGAPSRMTVLEGAQIIRGSAGNGRAIEVWEDDILDTAGIITHRALIIKSGDALTGGGTVNVSKGSLTLSNTDFTITIGEGNHQDPATGTGGLVHQSGGTITAPHIAITTGQFRISGGTVTASSTFQGLHFSPTSDAAGTTGGSLQVIGSAASITFGGVRNENDSDGRARPTFSFVLDNSAAHISTVNFTTNGASGATLRTNANLQVGLAGGVLLSGASAFTLIDRAASGNGDTAWRSGPNALWSDTTAGTKELITIGLAVAQDKGNLNASGFNPISFTGSNLGYVDLDNVNMGQTLQLGLDINGGTLSNFTNALTAAGIMWSTGSGNYELQLNLNPATSGGNYFAWDLSTIDSSMNIQGLAIMPIPEPSSALVVSGLLLAGVSRRRRWKAVSGR